MARGKRKKRKGGGGYQPPPETDPRPELRTIVDELGAADPAAAGPLWGRAHQTLLKAHVDPAAIMPIIAARDLDALTQLVERLERGDDAPEPDAPATETDVAHDIPADELRKAIRAFKKRLKLIRLDHESRLSVSPLSSGKSADVDAIMPPREFPDAVWQALVAEGRLRPAGKGFYELVE